MLTINFFIKRFSLNPYVTAFLLAVLFDGVTRIASFSEVWGLSQDCFIYKNHKKSLQCCNRFDIHYNTGLHYNNE
jgi:hypothetical protein